MLRDDRHEERQRPMAARNVLGEPLDYCSISPMTGFIAMAAATPAARMLAATRYAS